MEWICTVLEQAGSLFWGRGTIALVLAAGVYFTFGTGLFPLRRWRLVLRQTAGSLFGAKTGEVSPFQAMSAALGGTMGVGNILGVAAALRLGGPGAVFWIWVGALAGMMTKFAEVTLAVKYQSKTKQGRFGGPMYYMEQGLGLPLLGAIFALACTAGAFGTGGMTQSNAMALSLWDSFHIPLWLTGLAATLLTLAIAKGGAKRILRLSSLVVPFMAACYLAGAGAVLFCHRQNLLPSIALIFRDAFSPLAMGGGVVGFLSSQGAAVGISKGIFTHEAGLGSAPIAHACAPAQYPAQQGLWGIFEVFLDTVVVCTITALVILTTGVHTMPVAAHQMTAAAFSTVFGVWGPRFLACSIVFFAIAAIFSWCMYGQQALKYLRPGKKGPQRAFTALFSLGVFLGCVWPARAAWAAADLLNGLMLLPNIFALFLLSPQVFRETRRLEAAFPSASKKNTARE